jgi:hypothetical protein
MYKWNDLVRLAIADTQLKHGSKPNEVDIHYIGGLDEHKNPFIRIDLTPLPNLPKLKP